MHKKQKIVYIAPWENDLYVEFARERNINIYI